MSQATIKKLSNIDIELTAKFFRGLGDPNHLKILVRLLEKESDTDELVELLNCTTHQINRHLTCLVWCGYVISRESEGRNYYMIADRNIEHMINLAEGLMTNRAYFLNTCKIIK